MKWCKCRKATSLLFTSIVMGVLLLVSACTAGGAQTLEGILQNVDTVNGKITIVTKDGQSHVITIESKTEVRIDGTSVSLEAIEPGTYVEVELADESNDSARVVDARLVKIEGNITKVSSGEIEVVHEQGAQPVKIKISNTTRIILEEDRTGTMNDVKVGSKVEVKYDPQTMAALKIYVETEEEADVEGVITVVSGNSITIQTEKGRVLALTITGSTQIVDGTTAGLVVGKRAEVKFDPVNMVALKIELSQSESPQSSREQTEFDGFIVAISNNRITVQTDDGTVTANITSGTRIQLKEGQQGTVSDLKAGDRVEVYLAPNTHDAYKIELKEGDDSGAEDSSSSDEETEDGIGS